jgi:hypothetical protein
LSDLLVFADLLTLSFDNCKLMLHRSQYSMAIFCKKAKKWQK